LQPFNYKFLIVSGIGVAAYLITALLPPLPNFIADIFVRSSILSILFCLPIYLLNLSPDINEKADEVLRMLRIKN